MDESCRACQEQTGIDHLVPFTICVASARRHRFPMARGGRAVGLGLAVARTFLGLRAHRALAGQSLARAGTRIAFSLADRPSCLATAPGHVDVPACLVMRCHVAASCCLKPPVCGAWPAGEAAWDEAWRLLEQDSAKTPSTPLFLIIGAFTRDLQATLELAGATCILSRSAAPLHVFRNAEAIFVAYETCSRSGDAVHALGKTTLCITFADCSVVIAQATTRSRGLC